MYHTLVAHTLTKYLLSDHPLNTSKVLLGGAGKLEIQKSLFGLQPTNIDFRRLEKILELLSESLKT